jgi:tRNA A-37 threonylcarbamoyl transferase component Bud32
LYQADYERTEVALQSGQNVSDQLACLYISHYLERMGDALLNVGEALLFAATGEKLKFHDYVRLRETLSTRVPDVPVTECGLDFAWETRSGCRIAKVEDKSTAGAELEAIFKKGHLSKLRKERENIARWEDVMPGLPPKVLEFREGEKDAALLLEFLEGFTLRDLIFDGQDARIAEAMACLEGTLRTVWRATKHDQPVSPGFIDQVASRIDDVLRLHPDFATACCEVGSLSLASLEELLEEARNVERRFNAPFTVLAHGDLNTDNIIYNHDENKIHLIDLYRSSETDYVQDLSVFLVSNFRIPVFEGPTRDVLNRVTLRGYEFGLAFAAEMNDETFTERLMLGLARSFITSTRFEVDADFAKAMYMRAVYLLEKMIAGAPDRPGPPELSMDVLVY